MHLLYKISLIKRRRCKLKLFKEWKNKGRMCTCNFSLKPWLEILGSPGLPVHLPFSTSMKSLSFERLKSFSIFCCKWFYIRNVTASKRFGFKINLGLVLRLYQLKCLRLTTKWYLCGKWHELKYRKWSFRSVDKTTLPHILLFLLDSSIFSYLSNILFHEEPTTI